MSSQYPADLTFYLNRMNGWACNAVKLNPVGSNNEIAPSSLIEVELPQNTLINLSSLAMNFRAKFTGTTTCFVPRWFPNTMIKRVEVQVNGITLSAGSNNYASVYSMLASVTCPEDFCRYMSLNGGGQPTGAPPYLTADMGALATTLQPYYATTNWIGFLGSSQWLNSGLLGSVRVRIQLHSAEILNQTGADGDATFQLNDLDFSVQVASLDDGLYQQALLERLASGQQVSYPFKGYYTFEQNNTGTSASIKGTLSSSSVDRVTGVLRSTKYNDHTIVSTIGTAYQSGTTPFFTFCGRAYAAAAQDVMQAGIDAQHTTADLNSWQFLINSNFSPNYLVQTSGSQGGKNAIETRRSYGTQTDVMGGDLLNYSQNAMYPYLDGTAGGIDCFGAAFGAGGAAAVKRGDQVAQAHNHINNACISSVPLEYVGGQDRLVSGSNFRGSVGVIYWNINTSGANNAMLVVEVTSVLKVGSGGSAELVV